MKIVFKSENGHSPSWIYNGTCYYLYEDNDGSWSLMSRKQGFVVKDRFFKTSKGYKISPYALLDRFLKNKENVRNNSSYGYSFFYWKGMQFATDGTKIAIKSESKYERPSFDSYLECLADAKEYLEEKYLMKQMSLFG